MTHFFVGIIIGLGVCFFMVLACPRFIMNTGYKTEGGKYIYTDGRGMYYTLVETTLRYRKHEFQEVPITMGGGI